METEDGFQPVFFDPRPLKNLLLIDETSSLMPITDMKVGRARAGREVGEKGRLNQEQSELELIEPGGGFREMTPRRWKPSSTHL